jgi:hypothetical protein
MAGSARQSNSALQRSMLLRERVRDVVAQISYGDAAYGRRQFVKRAIELGQHAGLRLWSDRTVPMEQVGLGSLRSLLGEVTSGGRRGVNEHWVLDLWELVLHEHFHGPVRLVRDQESEPEQTPNSGVVVFADRKRDKQREQLQALPMRLMEAYLGRDDEMFMGLLLEVETIGKES